MAHAFLSDGWFEEADKILEEINPDVPEAVSDLVINLVVTGGPGGDIEARMAGGRLAKGLDADAPTKLTVPFDVAKGMFIDGDQNAAMQAFMSGQIQVEGDMTKLMAMGGGGGGGGGGGVGADAGKLRERLKEITE